MDVVDERFQSRLGPESMAVKLVLVLSLIVFLCCVIAAPAAELPGAKEPYLVGTGSTVVTGLLAGGPLEELCAYTREVRYALNTVDVKNLLQSSDAAVVTGRSNQLVTFMANADTLRGSRPGLRFKSVSLRGSHSQ